MRYHRSAARPGRCWPTPTPTCSAATELLNAFPFTVGVLVLVVFAVISLIQVDWGSPSSRCCCSRPSPSSTASTRPGREAGRRRAGARRSGVARRPRELRRRPRGQDPRPGPAGDRAHGRAGRRAARGPGPGRPHPRARSSRTIDAIPNIGIIVLLAHRLVAGEHRAPRHRRPGRRAWPCSASWRSRCGCVGFFLQEMPRGGGVDRPHRRRARPSRAARPSPTPGRRCRPVRWRSSFEHVGFAYEPGVAVLEDLDFTVAPGEVVALVGSTGSGKSTLCDLLVRLADPSTGTVRIGGVDTNEVEPDRAARPRWPWCSRRRSSSPTPSARTSPWAGPTPTTTSPPPLGVARADALRAGPARGPRHRDRRAGRHPVGRPAPAPGPGPGPAAPAPGAGARRRHLGRRPAGRGRDPRRAARRRSTPRRSWSPTASPPSSWPTGCCSSTTAAWSPPAPTPTCWPPTRPTPPSSRPTRRGQPAMTDRRAATQRATGRRTTTPARTRPRGPSARHDAAAQVTHRRRASTTSSAELAPHDRGPTGRRRRRRGRRCCAGASPSAPSCAWGSAFTVLMAMVTAGGRIVMPVLIQQILDKGVLGRRGLPRRLHASAACGLALAVTLGVAVAEPGHLPPPGHARPRTCCTTCGCGPSPTSTALSVADHNEAKRGVLTSRVTSDIETIARFAQWGAVAWIVDTRRHRRRARGDGRVLVALALVTVVVFVPMLPLMRMPAAPPAAGLRPGAHPGGRHPVRVLRERRWAPASSGPTASRTRARRRLDDAIDASTGPRPRAARYFALMFPLRRRLRRAGPGLGARRSAPGGARVGPRRRRAGRLPVPREPAAVARSPSWARSSTRPRPRSPAGARCSTCSTCPSTWSSPTGGVTLPAGPGRRSAPRASSSPTATGGRGAARRRRRAPGRHRRGHRRRDRLGQDHLRQAPVPPGRPHRRRASLLGGIDLRELAPASRHARGAHGAPGRLPLRRHRARERADGPPRRHRRATSTDAFERLGLGLVGRAACPTASTPRSASGARTCRSGERQLVALARAQLADPGLLVLDEATSRRRPRDRAGPGRRPGPPGRGPHHGQRRPPPLHRRGRRPGAGLRPGPDRRARPPRRARRRRRQLRRPLRELARATSRSTRRRAGDRRPTCGLLLASATGVPVRALGACARSSSRQATLAAGAWRSRGGSTQLGR